MDEQLSQGVALFNGGEFFRCHEVLEEAWKSESGPRRKFLQALIHIAVGFYHLQRGNAEGAIRQLKKGTAKLESYIPSCEGMDTLKLFCEVFAATEAIEAGGRLLSYPQIHAAGNSASGSDPAEAR